MLSFLGTEIDWSEGRGYGSVCETILTASPRGLDIPNEDTMKVVSKSPNHPEKNPRAIQ